MKRNALIQYLDDFLDSKLIQDYCPNGLQIEGKKNINYIIGGVTASQKLIDLAIKQKADAILVHHGFFWKSENPTITKNKKLRIKNLLENDINLIAYHLPIDLNHKLGNNMAIAELFDLKKLITPKNYNNFIWQGILTKVHSAEEIANILYQTLDYKPLVINNLKQDIKKLAWCSGAAQNMIETAEAMNADAFISGEISEQTVHFAIENDISYFAAGHHATECAGIRNLCKHISKQFDIKTEFINLKIPV